MSTQQACELPWPRAEREARDFVQPQRRASAFRRKPRLAEGAVRRASPVLAGASGAHPGLDPFPIREGRNPLFQLLNVEVEHFAVLAGNLTGRPGSDALERILWGCHV